MRDEPPKPDPAAGWYDDPEVPGGERYWDGSQWSDQRRQPERRHEPPPPEPPKREPARREPPSPAPAPGWYDDPDEPGGKRYWDGSSWTEKRPQGKSEGSLRRWYSSLSRGVQWLVAVVVGAGAVAGAIGAILALLPAPGRPLRASLSEVRVRHPFTLDTWAQHVAAENAQTPSGATASRLAANVLVEAGDQTTSPGGPTGAQFPQIQPTPISPEDAQTLNSGLDQALSNPTTPVTDADIGPACPNSVASVGCGLRSTATYLLQAHSPATPESVEQHFMQLFQGMRIPPSAGQPVGVPVNVDFSVTGLSGHTVTIKWTLYRDHGLAPVPEDWVKGESVLTVSGDAPVPPSTNREFWVPIPREAGPYYVQINVVDEDGNSLATEKGKPDFGYGGAPVSKDTVDEIPFAPFTDASAFTLYAPTWTPTIIEQASGDGASLTALVRPDDQMMAQVQQQPEEPLSTFAQKRLAALHKEHATQLNLAPTNIEGRKAYLLQYTHDEQASDFSLPVTGEAYVSVYLFNDAGSTWRVRVVAKTSVAGGKKLAADIAKKMTETFDPKS